MLLCAWLRPGAARGAPGVQPFSQFGIFIGDNGSGQERRIFGTGLANRQSADRHTGRHLHNGQKRILA